MPGGVIVVTASVSQSLDLVSILLSRHMSDFERGIYYFLVRRLAQKELCGNKTGEFICFVS